MHQKLFFQAPNAKIFLPWGTPPSPMAVERIFIFFWGGGGGRAL